LYKWNDDKNALLKSTRGFSFNDVLEEMSQNNDAIKEDAKHTLEYLKQKKQISINMKQSDLDFIKQKANDIGISYQNIIQALVHNYATGKLELRI